MRGKRSSELMHNHLGDLSQVSISAVRSRWSSDVTAQLLKALLITILAQMAADGSPAILTNVDVSGVCEFGMDSHC